MRVAVCCKGIPTGFNLDSVQLDGDNIKPQGADIYINEVDAYALEASIALKQAYGTEIYAISLGSLKTQEVLYYAIAKGVDHAILAEGETSRPELLANCLAHNLKEIEPHIILTGVQSEDWGGGEVGIYLSQALNMGLAYAVVEICELNDTSVRIKKELGGGKIAEEVVKLPAVLCVQSGIETLQYVSAIKRKKARKSKIQTGVKLNLSDAEQKIPGMMTYEFKEVALTPREGQAEMFTGERSEMAEKLLDIIRKTV